MGLGVGLGSTDTCHNGAVAPQNGGPRVLLIIPCFNEEASIGGVLNEIAATGRNYHTLVVDDGSTDATSAIASCRSPVARLAQNLGIGGAVQTGIKYAARRGFDFCIQIDGDGQHDPRAIETLLNAYRRQPANIISEAASSTMPASARRGCGAPASG